MVETLKNEELRHNLYTLLGTVYHLVFLTSGQCLIFDKEGNQIDDLQAEFTSGETNTPLLKLVAEHAKKFTLGKFREWMQEMDKEDFLRVTHLHNSATVQQSQQLVYSKCDEDGWVRENKGDVIESKLCDCKKADPKTM